MRIDSRDVTVMKNYNYKEIIIELFNHKDKKLKEMFFRDIDELISALKEKKYKLIKFNPKRIDFKTKEEKTFYIKITTLNFEDNFSTKVAKKKDF